MIQKVRRLTVAAPCSTSFCAHKIDNGVKAKVIGELEISRIDITQDVQWIQVTLPPIQRRARASLGRIIMIFMQQLQHGPVKVEMKPWVFCSTETWNFASVNSSQWGLCEWPGARTQLWGEGVWCDHSATGAYDQVVPKKPLGRGFFRCIWVKSNKSINSWPVIPPEGLHKAFCFWCGNSYKCC